jgi:hypothetical protein
MKSKWWESSALAFLMCFLVFPVGLVLLGANRKISWLSKILLSLSMAIIILVFFIYFQPIPRKQNQANFSVSADMIQYKINQFYTKTSLINGLQEKVEPKENEIFLCVDIEVTNEGDRKLFYVSLIDNPVVETVINKYYPDLTLSEEPFGDIKPKQTLSGFLVFRIPEDEKPITFKIASLSKKIDF